MPLIRAIEVENFHSIRSMRLDDLTPYVPIVGLNSSGKSNLLRALNLFFNGVVDDETGGLNLLRDYSDFAPKGKKRIVTVGVELTLGSNFKVRGQDAFLSNNGIADTIAIRRRWSADPQSRDLVESYEFGPDLGHVSVASIADVASLRAFTRAIIFRYVPNHVRPSDLMTRLLRPLRGDLVARLQVTKEYKESSVDGLMTGLVRMGDRMFETVSTRVSRGLNQVRVSPNLPADFAELAFDVALSSVSQSGTARPPDAEGSGTQTFMLLHVLDLADRAARRSGFGWVQATVWAFEEPESFLHAGLRSRFAQDLHEYALADRRQVYCTTHQDEFVTAGGVAWLADRSDDGTTLQRLTSRNAVRESNKRAISVYRHPLIETPDVPLVLLEGRFDAVYLRAAIKEANLRPRWRVVSPDDDLEPDTAGDALEQYLKWNKAALASRPDKSPAIVVRDWEAKDAGGYNAQLASHPYSKCVTCPKDLANPELGPSFVGIERYLPTELIIEVVGADNLGTTAASAGGAHSIDPKILSLAKPQLAARVSKGASVGSFVIELVKWIDGQVDAALKAIPAEEFG